MNEIKIKNCNDCPFRFSDYDDFSTSEKDTCEICILARYLEFDDDIIECYSMYKKESDNFIRPEWCPIKNGGIKISDIQ